MELKIVNITEQKSSELAVLVLFAVGRASAHTNTLLAFANTN